MTNDMTYRFEPAARCPTLEHFEAGELATARDVANDAWAAAGKLRGELERATAERDRLVEENETLRHLAGDLQWMARRYAEGRRSVTAGVVNLATRHLLKMGVVLNAHGDKTVWARDGMGRAYDGLTEAEATPGTPEAMGVPPAGPRAAGEGEEGR